MRAETNNRTFFTTLLSLAIGGIFVYASIDKIINPEAFARIIHNYRLLPPAAINGLAIFLPWLELTAGLCLILGFNYKSANLLIFLMTLVFIAALETAYFRGINLNCGCFTTAATTKSNLLARIIEDFLILVGNVIIHLNISFKRYKRI